MQHTTDSLRTKWLEFYKSKDHAIIPSSGVIPENDPTALFYNSGMHPLVPYLMGEKHPLGVRLANSQKCIRTGDIDEVGDATHLTFFEMLGNWSLGDFFKEEQIAWSFEFLTQVLELPLERLAVSVFEGDENAPRDDEAAEIWEKVGMPKHKIAYLDANENWWAKGETGPCGPDSEMFYWTGDLEDPELQKPYQETWENPNWVEIWNDVFMQFNKLPDGSLEPLPAQNVDTGMGLERTVAVLNGLKSVYQTDAFENILAKISELSEKPELAQNPLGETKSHNSMRVIADHIRSATTIMADKVAPSNVDQGYILRRLIRRAIRHGRKLGIVENMCQPIAQTVIEKLKNAYPELEQNKDFILEEFKIEEEQFRKTLEKGEKVFEKELKILEFIFRNPSPENLSLLFLKKETIKSHFKFKKFEKLFKFIGKNRNSLNPKIPLNEKENMIFSSQDVEFVKKELEEIKNSLCLNGSFVFDLFQTYGFPLEITEELAQEKGLKIDKEGYEKAFKEHQEKSRTASAGKFKGGLSRENIEQETAYHTATHLLLAGLREVLGDHVHQAGSNITAQRLRFDFSHGEKLTPEQKEAVEKYVNDAIAANAKQVLVEMKKEEAKAQGVEGSFWEKYPDIVKVYSFEDDSGKIWTKELCGGPHVKSTGELGRFKIKKEQSSGRGVRRIKAVLN